MRPTLTSKSDRSGNDLSQRVGAAADGLKGLTRKSLREKTCALVAQLDRASDFESEGREFESLRARQFSSPSFTRRRLSSLRRFQLHLAANGAHVPILNHAVAALRFFFRVTLRGTEVRYAAFVV